MKVYVRKIRAGSYSPIFAARTSTRREWGTQFAFFLVATLVVLAGCHSYHVETTVENHTGEPIRLLEVEYPSASFGVNSMAAGEEYHYRIQLRGIGPIKVQYMGSDGRKTQVEGPMLSERQEGLLEIVLLPGGIAEFHPDLTDAIVRTKKF